ncbi:ribonucrease Y, partial [Candidatus Kryptonium thompsonii]
EEAEREANNIKKEKLLEERDERFRINKKLETEVNQIKQKLQSYEKQLLAKEEKLNERAEELNRRERDLNKVQQQLEEQRKSIELRQKEIEQIIEEQKAQLEKIAGLTRDEAKKILIESMVSEAKAEAAKIIREIREQAKEEAKKEAQKIIVQAIQRTAADHSVETTVTVLHIPNDELKGRIIGREGRNIRAFEQLTGCDIIVDDTPEAVIISGFDPFRREVAKIALERLLADGRIHPARIEEVVEKVKQELEEEMIKVGENTLLELGIHNVHREIVRLVGKMKYRSSYGQNVLQHSIEVAYLAAIMASELGLDSHLAKRAGLFHDIGKVVDKQEGPHALIGYEILNRYGEHPIVVNAVGSHHEDIPMESPIAAIVQAADAISGARPGARRESVEGYVRRLQKLEEIAKSFEGVAKTYAIQAGREVRVIVEPDKVDDNLADQLSRDIAAKIQEEMEYPGQIKVTVIREVRSVAYAK